MSRINEVKYYIPYNILNITKTCEIDPSFMHCMRLAYKWANDMGLEGKEVRGLNFKEFDVSDPVNYGRYLVSTEINCTKEERIEWEANQRGNEQSADK